jgi:pyruvate-ferredoxin/flavodoxin oxidoreductase
MPLFVHDPRKGDTWPERLSLEGNPDVDSPWTTQTLVATNEQGKPEIIDVPLTPAEFAYGEVRFAQHFRLLPAGTADATPIAEFVELTPEARTGKVPYILVANEGQPLKKIQVSDSIVELVEDRQRFWQTLRFLAGRDQARLTAEAKAQVAALQQQVVEATEGRELAMDEIATAMAQLATAKDPNSVVWPSFVGPTGSVAPASAVRPTTVSTPATVPAAPAAASKAPTASAAAPSATGLGPKPADAPISCHPTMSRNARTARPATRNCRRSSSGRRSSSTANRRRPATCGQAAWRRWAP